MIHIIVDDFYYRQLYQNLDEVKKFAAQKTIVPPKANKKQDLIASILASEQAIKVYNRIYNPPAPDDLLAPPEDFDWEGDDTGPKEQKPATAVKPASKPPIKPSSNKPSSTVTETPKAAKVDDPVVDDELEKRKKRAERFGIPLVEPSSQPAKKPRNTVDDPAKLKAREDRFGSAKQTENIAGKRRTRDTAVDAEEQERRKKRAERFGTSASKN